MACYAATPRAPRVATTLKSFGCFFLHVSTRDTRRLPPGAERARVEDLWPARWFLPLVTHALRRDSFATVVWRVEGTLSRICDPARVRTSLLCRAEMDGFGAVIERP